MIASSRKYQIKKALLVKIPRLFKVEISIFQTLSKNIKTISVLLDKKKFFFEKGEKKLICIEVGLLFPAGARLLWLSAGSQNIWAVDSRGQVYLRIGTEAPSAHGLNQAWVPVDGTTDSSDSKFLRIYVGHNDWMVSYINIWHIDTFIVLNLCTGMFQ